MDNDYASWNQLRLDPTRDFPYAFYEVCRTKLKCKEEPKLLIASNLNLKGRYAEVWLVLTTKRIFIMEKDNDQIEIRHYHLKQIKDVQLLNFYGAGLIQITTEKGVIELVRFTRKYLKMFTIFLELLQKAVRKESFDLDKEFFANEEVKVYGDKRCPECGTPYAKDSSFCPRCDSRHKTFARLFVYVKPYWGRIILMFFTTFCYSFLNLIPPYLQRFMLDEVIVKKRIDLIKIVILAILLVHLCRAVFQGLRTYQLSWLGQKITYDLRSAVYTHLHKLGLSYYDKRMTGSIMTRVTGDTREIQRFVINGLEQVIVEVFSLVIITFILFSMDGKMALIVLLPTPIIFFGTKKYQREIKKVYRRVWRRRSDMNAVLGGTIPGIRVVKAFSQEEEEIKRFQGAMNAYFNEEIRAIKHRAIFFPAISVTTALGAVLIWGYGGYRVINDLGLSVGTLMAFISYMWRFYEPIRSLSNLSGQYQRAITATERVFEVLDQKPEFESKEGNIILSGVKGEIVFDNVSFQYQAEEEVLKNINLRIKPGEMIGLVGASGSGKSTLVNLVAGFYRPHKGVILVDGYDIENVDLKSLRSQIGFVLQEPFLFFGTVAENIAYGKPEASMEEIVWAANAANAHEFIMEFPDAYDTLIGERGVGLSGGQKQRISIARAILKNPKILILDEATSSVDTVTEKTIQEAIDRLIKNRTTIAIAHRLSTLRNADRVLVLEKGEIVEEGTHQELMSKDGNFKRMVDIQAEIAKERIVI